MWNRFDIQLKKDRCKKLPTKKQTSLKKEQKSNVYAKNKLHWNWNYNVIDLPFIPGGSYQEEYLVRYNL